MALTERGIVVVDERVRPLDSEGRAPPPAPETIHVPGKRGRISVAGHLFRLVVPLGCFSIGFPRAGPRLVTAARGC